MSETTLAGFMLGMPVGMVLMLVLGFGFFWGIQVVNAWQWKRVIKGWQGRRG